jgi:hypothetical protein
MNRLRMTSCVLLAAFAAQVYAQTSSTSSQATSGPTTRATTGTTTGTGRLPHAPSEAVLVVPGKALDAQTLDRIVEDLTIMSRIIEKGLSSPDFVGTATDATMAGVQRTLFSFGGRAGPDVLSPPAGQVKPMYVGGYGAVFFLQVTFPLLPPPEASEATAKTDQADPVWAATKRSLQEPAPSPFDPYRQEAPAPEPYNRETVDSLKAQLIGNMKHAANIGAIAPEEWLAIVVQGTAPQGQDPATTPPATKAVLTLRAKKADIDLFAADKLDRTQFEQRVQTITY